MTARLVPLSEGSVAVTLDKAITLIGRHPDCDVVLDDNQKISRRHCCIAQVENRLVLRDLGSMNGIRVNGEAVNEIDLREGDEITIGDEEFVLELTSGSNNGKRSDRSVPQTPNPRRRPRPSLPPPPSRRSTMPDDISREFPVAIPDEAEDEDLRLNFAVQTPVPPEPAVNKVQVNFTDPPPSDDERIFELDSGELKLDDLNNLGQK